MKLVYFSYPYSDNPKRRTEEIKQIVRKILQQKRDIVPLIPHLIFDALYDFPEGYSHPEFALMEFYIISKCDLFVYPKQLIWKSPGCRWERAFAMFLQIPVITYRELLEEG